MRSAKRPVEVMKGGNSFGSRCQDTAKILFLAHLCAKMSILFNSHPQMEIDRLLLGERSGFFHAVKLGQNLRTA